MTAAFIQPLSSSVPTIVEIAFEIVWKAAVLCLAVWGAHVLAGRDRMLLRSALWHLCLIGLLLLPMAVVVSPRLRIATPFAERQGELHGSAFTTLKSPGGVDDFAPLAATHGPNSPTTAEGFETAVKFSDARSAQHVAESNAVAAHSSATLLHFGEMALPATVSLYLATLTILLIRLAASLTAVAALRRTSIPVANSAWLQALARWHSQFAMRLPVQLLLAECVSVPLVVGWRRPAILLPPGLAQTTDRQAIDAVLLHELTHVGRGDYAWNLLLRIVQAIYWPHPFVWFTGRMVRRAREDVCDAVCVHWMKGAGAYCEILLDVAAGLVRSSEVALGMAMTRSSRLGPRLARVQQTSGTDRGLLGRPARATIAVLVIVSACLLGAVQIVARVSAAGQGLPNSLTDSASELVNAESTAGAAQDFGLAIADESPTEDKSKPLRIVTAKVKRGTFEKTTVQPASLEPFGQISIHSRNAGVVSQVNVNVGDLVKAGEVLAELDAFDISTEIAEKEAALALADADEEHAKVAVEAANATVQSLAAKLAQAEVEAEKAANYEKFRKIQYDRIKHLFELKSIDERLVDEKTEQLRAAESESRSATAKIGSATAERARGEVDVRLAESSLKPAALRVATARADLKRALSKTRDDFRLIRSPIDGVVLEKHIDVDVNVKSRDGKPLFRLAGTGLITAVVMLPERDGLLVKRNNSATVSFDSLDKAGPIAGKVSRIAYSIDPVTRTLRAEISLPNADGKLKPGMFGRATVVVDEIPDVLWIPTSAVGELSTKDTGANCVRIVNRRAVRTPVKLGRNNGNQVEIIEGLSEGDIVVVEFQKAPADGE